MEEVEAANKAAVETCHRVLNLLWKPKPCKHLQAETEVAVFKFKRVLSLLSHGRGRVRKLKKNLNPLPLPHNIFLDGPNYSDISPKPLQLLPPTFPKTPHKEKVFLGSPVPKTKTLQQHQEERTKLQFHPQRVKYRDEMVFSGSNSGINLAFDRSSSSCKTSTTSARSFMSCLSIVGCAATTGRDSFRLIGGVPRAFGQISQQQRRKLKEKRSYKVPAISDKISDIPSDEYSWRKYGQKPIKGSLYPRLRLLRQAVVFMVVSNLTMEGGYYKCSSIRGCPARKRVERCLEDPSMLVVTYQGEHKHSQSA
ncbi:hypothetical protein DVH24_036785 [Malus domestica]|uniref:WRKY domain-containing protein n=1 Tax=Malus domestica TaxID=3750 RepID=A0A498IJZ3_MALDO|nr:hypothetical protein DVH24_036785 [Malus domestica]